MQEEAPVPQALHPVLLKVKNPVLVQALTFPVEQTTLGERHGTQDV